MGLLAPPASTGTSNQNFSLAGLFDDEGKPSVAPTYDENSATTIRFDLEAPEAHLTPIDFPDWSCPTCGRTQSWWPFIDADGRRVADDGMVYRSGQRVPALRCAVCDPPRRMSAAMRRLLRRGS